MRKLNDKEMLENLIRKLEDTSIYGSLYRLNVDSLVDEHFVDEGKTYTRKEVRNIMDMTECEMARAILHACGIDDE